MGFGRWADGPWVPDSRWQAAGCPTVWTISLPNFDSYFYSYCKAGVLATEYGGSSSSLDDDERVGNLTNQFDFHRGTSGTMWTWKENGNWGLFQSHTKPSEPNGPIRPVRLRINSRIYARAVAGGILEHTFDRHTGSFHLKAAAELGWTQPTEVYIPPHLKEGQPVVSGMAKLKQVAFLPHPS